MGPAQDSTGGRAWAGSILGRATPKILKEETVTSSL